MWVSSRKKMEIHWGKLRFNWQESRFHQQKMWFHCDLASQNGEWATKHASLTRENVDLTDCITGIMLINGVILPSTMGFNQNLELRIKTRTISQVNPLNAAEILEHHGDWIRMFEDLKGIWFGSNEYKNKYVWLIYIMWFKQRKEIKQIVCVCVACVHICKWNTMGDRMG